MDIYLGLITLWSQRQWPRWAREREKRSTKCDVAMDAIKTNNWIHSSVTISFSTSSSTLLCRGASSSSSSSESSSSSSSWQEFTDDKVWPSWRRSAAGLTADNGARLSSNGHPAFSRHKIIKKKNFRKNWPGELYRWKWHTHTRTEPSLSLVYTWNDEVSGERKFFNRVSLVDCLDCDCTWSQLGTVCVWRVIHCTMRGKKLFFRGNE
jgi:hypothetical protein